MNREYPAGFLAIDSSLFDVAAHCFPALSLAIVAVRVCNNLRPPEPLKGEIDSTAKTHLLEGFFFYGINSLRSWERPQRLWCGLPMISRTELRGWSCLVPLSIPNYISSHKSSSQRRAISIKPEHFQNIHPEQPQG